MNRRDFVKSLVVVGAAGPQVLAAAAEPSDSDWDQIADLTCDSSWRGAAMWKYFQRIESCRHRPRQRFWRSVGLDPSGHGWSGWLPTEKAAPREASPTSRCAGSSHDR